MQQHHGQEAVRLRLIGHQLGERAPEPQRLGRKVAAAAVALVEYQVDDREHGGEPIRQQVVGRHSERDAGGLDLALRPHQPLRHRRLGHQEGARDLVGGEAAEGAQGEGHLRVDGERRMTAGEDELEPLVGKRRRVHRVLHCLLRLEQARLCDQRVIAAKAIDGSVACRRHQPALRGDRERLLRGLLGEVEVAEKADQRGEHTSPLVAEGLVEGRYHSMIGRTSIAPPRRAAGIRAASSIAASRSSAS